MIEALFFVPVGPDDIGRVEWAVQSIRTYARDFLVHLLLDGPSPDDLPATLQSKDIRVHLQNPPTRGNWGKIWLMQCRAMAEALEDPNVSSKAILVKMDADALLVREGVCERAQRIFATRPRAGQIGQCFSTISGNALPNFGWANHMRVLRSWRGLRDFLRGALKEKESLSAGVQAFADFRALLALACRNGYRDGEFAIGGSYILRREVIEIIAAKGWLTRTPFRFLPATGEDIVMTPHVYAAGYAAMDDVSDAGIFAVEGVEFRLDPFMLKQRGHFILHPTKYGYHGGEHPYDEAELVAALIDD